MGGLFEADLFDESVDAAALTPIDLQRAYGNASDAFVLWHAGALDARSVEPGADPIVAGYRVLASRAGMAPSHAVQVQNARLLVADDLVAITEAARVRLRNLTSEGRRKLKRRFSEERAGGRSESRDPVPESAPVPLAAADEGMLPSDAGSGRMRPPGAPPWVPYAIVGGGALVAGGIVWMAIRRQR